MVRTESLNRYGSFSTSIKLSPGGPSGRNAEGGRQSCVLDICRIASYICRWQPARWSYPRSSGDAGFGRSPMRKDFRVGDDWARSRGGGGPATEVGRLVRLRYLSRGGAGL